MLPSGSFSHVVIHARGLTHGIAVQMGPSKLRIAIPPCDLDDGILRIIRRCERHLLRS